MDMESILSGDRLQKAFEMFDQDGSGSIGAAEISKVLNLANNPALNEKVKEIINAVDKDGNGEISLKEFH